MSSFSLWAFQNDFSSRDLEVDFRQTTLRKQFKKRNKTYRTDFVNKVQTLLEDHTLNSEKWSNEVVLLEGDLNQNLKKKKMVFNALKNLDPSLKNDKKFQHLVSQLGFSSQIDYPNIMETNLKKKSEMGFSGELLESRQENLKAFESEMKSVKTIQDFETFVTHHFFPCDVYNFETAKYLELSARSAASDVLNDLLQKVAGDEYPITVFFLTSSKLFPTLDLQDPYNLKMEAFLNKNWLTLQDKSPNNRFKDRSYRAQLKNRLKSVLGFLKMEFFSYVKKDYEKAANICRNLLNYADTKYAEAFYNVKLSEFLLQTGTFHPHRKIPGKDIKEAKEILEPYCNRMLDPESFAKNSIENSSLYNLALIHSGIFDVADDENSDRESFKDLNRMEELLVYSSEHENSFSSICKELLFELYIGLFGEDLYGESQELKKEYLEKARKLIDTLNINEVEKAKKALLISEPLGDDKLLMEAITCLEKAENWNALYQYYKNKDSLSNTEEKRRQVYRVSAAINGHSAARQGLARDYYQKGLIKDSLALLEDGSPSDVDLFIIANMYANPAFKNVYDLEKAMTYYEKLYKRGYIPLVFSKVQKILFRTDDAGILERIYNLQISKSPEEAKKNALGFTIFLTTKKDINERDDLKDLAEKIIINAQITDEDFGEFIGQYDLSSDEVQTPPTACQSEDTPSSPLNNDIEDVAESDEDLTDKFDGSSYSDPSYYTGEIDFAASNDDENVDKDPIKENIFIDPKLFNLLVQLKSKQKLSMKQIEDLTKMLGGEIKTKKGKSNNNKGIISFKDYGSFNYHYKHLKNQRRAEIFFNESYWKDWLKIVHDITSKQGIWEVI